MIALNKAFNCTELVIQLDQQKSWEEVLKKVEEDFSSIVKNKNFFLNSLVVLKLNKNSELEKEPELAEKLEKLRSLEQEYKLTIEVQSNRKKLLFLFESAGFRTKYSNSSAAYSKLKIDRVEKAEKLLSFLPSNTQEMKTAFIGLSRESQEGVTLRSGARVVYDGSVVVVGDVNSGSQVKASGSIFVLGTVRGSLHAGFKESDPEKLSELVIVCSGSFDVNSQVAIGPIFSCLDLESNSKTAGLQVARLVDQEICLS